MSLYKDASLVMLPSAYKDGKLYSIRPTDGDGDFTFSRGSNLAATRVDVNGLIEKGRENLALQGSDISTQSGSWSANQGGVTTQNAATSPIGTNTASQITANGSNTYSGVRDAGIVMGALRYTYSVYLKAQSGTPDIRLTCYDGVTFHQQDFSITTEWERYSITFTPTAGTHNIYITSQQAVSWYAWGAQFELGLVATDYIETGASTAQAGILEDMPRLDYSGGASCPSLLLEPQRSNLIEYSEYASGNALVGSPTITENFAVSPDGAQNAFKIDSVSGGQYKRIRKILSVSANSTYTCSYFIKKATSAVTTFSGIGMVWQNGTQKVNYIIVDEYNGTMYIAQDQTGNTSTQVDDYGTYWRFSASATDTGSNTTFESAFYGCLSTDGTSIGLGAKTWVGYGLQLEQGSYPTSYIPTYGTSQTRSQEYGRTPLETYDVNEEQGVIFAEFEYLGGTDFQVLSMHNGGSLVDWLMVDSAGKLRGSVFYDGTYKVSMDSSPTTMSPNTYYKAAFRYESGNNALYLNGVKVGTNTSTFTNPPTLGYVQLGGFWQLSNTNVNCRVKQAVLFPTALTDSECIALTTL